ncbi:hypothetical protein ACFQH9_06550 [Pseudonocardia lutea]|uniref:Uncharacterized protein n=1 Tax=Pseudonocardia lutea TaxID=2172015 RepID=A0ABW1I3Z8_9PSEU
MTWTANDATIAHALHRFAVVAGPVLNAMEKRPLVAPESGVAGRIVMSVTRPADGTLKERTNWWVRTIGGAAILLAKPAAASPLASKLPVEESLAAAGEGLVLCGIAREYGLVGPGRQAQLLAEVLFDARVPSTTATTDRASLTGERSVTDLAAEALRLGQILHGLGGRVRESRAHRKGGGLLKRVPGMAAVTGIRADLADLNRVAAEGRIWLDRSLLIPEG